MLPVDKNNTLNEVFHLPQWSGIHHNEGPLLSDHRFSLMPQRNGLNKNEKPIDSCIDAERIVIQSYVLLKADFIPEI